MAIHSDRPRAVTAPPSGGIGARLVAGWAVAASVLAVIRWGAPEREAVAHGVHSSSVPEIVWVDPAADHEILHLSNGLEDGETEVAFMERMGLEAEGRGLELDSVVMTPDGQAFVLFTEANTDVE